MENVFEYYDLLVYYVDYVLVIIKSPSYTIHGLKHRLWLKGNKSEEPRMYPGVYIQVFESVSGNKCLSMSP